MNDIRYDCPIVQLRQDHQTDEVRSFILCRTKYSPYEGDWWEFRSRQREGPFVHQQWEASAHILTEGPIRSPVILSQTELARDLSNTLHLLAETPSRCFWSMIPYKVPLTASIRTERVYEYVVLLSATVNIDSDRI